MTKMKSLDILVDTNLLQEQYEFLLKIPEKFGEDFFEDDNLFPAWGDDLWDGILNFFETILEIEHGTD